jgi:hypothetical protein
VLVSFVFFCCSFQFSLFPCYFACFPLIRAVSVAPACLLASPACFLSFPACFPFLYCFGFCCNYPFNFTFRYLPLFRFISMFICHSFGFCSLSMHTEGHSSLFSLLLALQDVSLLTTYLHSFCTHLNPLQILSFRTVVVQVFRSELIRPKTQ